MRILVTGGAGFIGSHIVDAYIAAGHTVSVVDNLYHGFRRNLNPKAQFFKVDIRQLAVVRRVLQQTRPDIINHHAAISEVVQSMRQPLRTMNVNVIGTTNLLTAAGAATDTGSNWRLKKIIFASTGGTIYGNAEKIPTPETAPLRPESMYALSKQLGEELIQYYARAHKFAYTIFRYGNVFGRRQDPHGEAGVIAIFAQRLHQYQVVTLFGDGSKTRDYIYIPDVVQANRLALRHGHNLICNIGLGRQIRDDAVYHAVRHHFPAAQPPRYKAVRAGEVIHGAIKPTIAKQQLGWQAHWTLRSGIADYVKAMHYV